MTAKLILASSSPRREKMLKNLGLKFTIVPSKINEDKFNSLPPIQMVTELARAKAEEVADLVENTIIIAADTIVVFKDKILGKPVNQEDAIRMLSQLQGNKHIVYTGLAVYNTDNQEILVDYDQTSVYIQKMTEGEIISYVNTGEPKDKAGAYAIQGIGGAFIEKICGSYFTVMGLPIHKMMAMLKKFSVNIF